MITLELTNAQAEGLWAHLREEYPSEWYGNPLDFGDPQQAASPLALATEKLYKAMLKEGLATP